jgi:hypothetical protein
MSTSIMVLIRQSMEPFNQDGSQMVNRTTVHFDVTYMFQGLREARICAGLGVRSINQQLITQVVVNTEAGRSDRQRRLKRRRQSTKPVVLRIRRPCRSAGGLNA